MRLMITGGGTGGHVYPGVAVAREVKRMDSAHEVLFVGAERGVEARLVPKEGFNIEILNVTGLKGRGLMGKASSVARLALAVKEAAGVISRFRPDVVLGVGGYASGPVCIAAAFMRKPLALAEQNVIPGMTNRWMKRFAGKAFVTWRESEKYFPEGVAMWTGNPIRPEFFTASRKRGDERMNILVTGGSQGARSINNAMSAAVEKLNTISNQISVTHQAGAAGLEAVRKAYGRASFPCEVEAFFDDMPQRLADADIVISRAGAGAVAEICATGRAAVYVPFPHAADDHQTRNAEAMVNAGAALMINDAKIDADTVFEVISKFAGDRRSLEDMGAKAKMMAKPDAAARIADELLKLAGEKEAA